MYSFQRILIGLDLTEMDENLFRFASVFLRHLDVETVYLVHVARNLELPEDLLDKYPDLMAPLDESITGSIKSKAKDHFKGAKFEIKVEVKEGHPVDTIMRWTDIKNIDLMIMGRKKELKGSGVIPGKLVNISNCSILFVPENPPKSIKKIMVPVDFSKNAAHALTHGYNISTKSQAEIVVQNTYSVPSGYHKTGKSFDEFADIMKDHAQKDFEKFLKENDIEKGRIKCLLTLEKEYDTAKTTYLAAKKEKADLLIMGSKGRTKAASFLLGSKSDKMTRQADDIPLLVVKNKRDNMDFFKALLKV